MTEILKTSINLGDGIKLMGAVIIPLTFYGYTIDKRVTLLEIQNKELKSQILEIKAAQNRMADAQDKILSKLIYLQYVLEARNNKNKDR